MSNEGTWNIEMGIENLVAIVLIAQLPTRGRSVGDRDISATDQPKPRSSFGVVRSGTALSRSSYRRAAWQTSWCRLLMGLQHKTAHQAL